jgi:hypothetical protein
MLMAKWSMAMDITPSISGHSLTASSLIFIGALLDWATLVVDPSGNALPDHVIRAHQRHAEGYLSPSCSQTAEQQQAWQQHINTFYQRIKARIYAAEQTFSPSSIATIHAEVLRLPTYKSLVEQRYYPEPMVVGIHNPHHAQEEAIARYLTEYMLHLNAEEALRFLEQVVILWAVQLPRDQLDQLQESLARHDSGTVWSEAELRAYALYSYVAEPLER